MLDEATGWTDGRLIPEGPGRVLGAGMVRVMLTLLVLTREPPGRDVCDICDILLYIHRQHFLYTIQMQQVTRRQVAIPPYTASSIFCFKSTKWRQCSKYSSGSTDTIRADCRLTLAFYGKIDLSNKTNNKRGGHSTLNHNEHSVTVINTSLFSPQFMTLSQYQLFIHCYQFV